MKDDESSFGVKILFKKLSVKLSLFLTVLALPESLGSSELLRQLDLKRKSSNRQHRQHDPEVGEKSFQQEVYLDHDHDLSGYWFFLDSFSPSWLEMPLPAEHGDVDAFVVSGMCRGLGCWRVVRK